MADSEDKLRDDISRLEKKKQEIQKELEVLQDDLEHSLDDIRTGVSSRLEVSYWIKKYPLESLGIAILGGFWFGIDPKSRIGQSTQVNFVWDELKSLLAKKAVQKIVKALEEKID